MAHDRLEDSLRTILADKAGAGTLKGEEDVITGILPATAGHGPPYLLDSQDGLALLQHLQSMTSRFREGLVKLGYETVEGAHPVVPLMTRDTAKTQALVAHLRSHGILATGLAFPVVPRGDEEIRFQVSADHTAADIDHALDVLTGFRDDGG